MGTLKIAAFIAAGTINRGKKNNNNVNGVIGDILIDCQVQQNSNIWKQEAEN